MVSTTEIYAFGMPRNADFSRVKFDGNKGSLAMFRIDPSTTLTTGMTSGCTMLDVVMIDVTMSHYSEFYLDFKAWGAYEISNKKRYFLTFSISAELNDIDKIGTSKNAVFQIKVPFKVRCISNEMEYTEDSNIDFTSLIRVMPK